MDLGKVLADLRQELESLDAAILSLERLQQVKPRRGRPPGRRSLSRAAQPDGLKTLRFQERVAKT